MRSPSRMCVGCRRARPKDRLVRLVRSPNGVVVTDPSARAVGRGAYVCPDTACLDRALTGGRLGRAFRKPCVPSPDLALAVQAASRPEADMAGPDPGTSSEVHGVDVMAVRV